jgi:sugar phosphate isomerase/epimerase
MRLLHRDGTIVHLSYCTNVHPAETLDGVIAQLERFAGPVRERLGAPLLGVGLWLARGTATTLRTVPGALPRLRAELLRHRLEVVTLNGFPYAGFHDTTVKKAVYSPDWTEQARLDYTVDLAHILAALLPADAVRGSISTLPLGWREPWTADQHEASVGRLASLSAELEALRVKTGRVIRLALEPEPGCIVQETTQAARLWGPIAGASDFAAVTGAPGPSIGVCLDACHLATGWEEPSPALDRLSAAGLPIVKLQASAALQVDDPSDPASRAALEAFAEQKFLHQTRERTAGAPLERDDLADALGGNDPLPALDAWRVHFHVPMHAEPARPLRSTRDHLDQTLAALFAGPKALTDHVELETYTWGVLPIGTRPEDDAGLVNGIAAEIEWVRDRLLAHGLTEAPAAVGAVSR